MQNTEILHSHQAIIRQAFSTLFSFCPTVIHHQLMKDIVVKEIYSDTVFIKKGEECDGIYIVLDGAVKIYMEEPKKRVLHYAGMHEVIGQPVAMENYLFRYYASSMENSVLAYLPFSKLQELMIKQPRLFFSLMNLINKQTALVENHSLMVLSEPSEKLVIRTIQDLKSRFGLDSQGYIKLHISVKELAGYIGMSKTSLYRILQSLKTKNLISQHLDKLKPSAQIL